MSKYYSILCIIPLICCVAIIQGCKKDPLTGISPTITSKEAQWSAARGQSIFINLHISAPVSIQDVIVNSKNHSDQKVNIGEGVKETDIEIPFIVPAESQLNEVHNISVEVTDIDGNMSMWETEVITSALINTPANYEFERDGKSSVDFSGQTERLDMISAIKAYLIQGDQGQAISAQILMDAFENRGSNGNGLFDFTSTKQLKNKIFSPDQDQNYFENLFLEAEKASTNGAQQIIAENGTAGILIRESNQRSILVNSYGQEFTQLVEKGFMGSVMLHQIYNTYLSDDQIGPNVENVHTADGKPYTDREHHWDEAYGYFHAPSDFKSGWPSDRRGELRFLSNYSNTADAHLGLNDTIMRAYIKGRAAIVNNDQKSLEEARSMLYTHLELIPAAIAVHYINATLEAINSGNIGDAFHTLTEAWAFTRCLIYHPARQIPLDVIDSILLQDFGTDGNFWTATPAGLQNAKTKLVTHFPLLAPIQDEL